MKRTVTTDRPRTDAPIWSRCDGSNTFDAQEYVFRDLPAASYVARLDDGRAVHGDAQTVRSVARQSCRHRGSIGRLGARLPSLSDVQSQPPHDQQQPKLHSVSLAIRSSTRLHENALPGRSNDSQATGNQAATDSMERRGVYPVARCFRVGTLFERLGPSPLASDVACGLGHRSSTLRVVVCENRRHLGWKISHYPGRVHQAGPGRCTQITPRHDHGNRGSSGTRTTFPLAAEIEGDLAGIQKDTSGGETTFAMHAAGSLPSSEANVGDTSCGCRGRGSCGEASRPFDARSRNPELHRPEIYACYKGVRCHAATVTIRRLQPSFSGIGDKPKPVIAVNSYATIDGFLLTAAAGFSTPVASARAEFPMLPRGGFSFSQR